MAHPPKPLPIADQLRAVSDNWPDLSDRQRTAILDIVETTAKTNRQLAQATPKDGHALIDIDAMRRYLGQ